jgi:hypothetical protein
MVNPLHHKALPIQGIVRLVHLRRGSGHLLVGIDSIPAGLLLANPLVEPYALGLASHHTAVFSPTPQLLSQREDALAGPLMDLVQDWRKAATAWLAQGGGVGGTSYGPFIYY